LVWIFLSDFGFSLDVAGIWVWIWFDWFRTQSNLLRVDLSLIEHWFGFGLDLVWIWFGLDLIGFVCHTATSRHFSLDHIFKKKN
jgi:hypothetical protein